MNGAKTVVYGAGGHGKVVGDILLCARMPNFVGYVDDNRSRWDSVVLGLPVLGGYEWLSQQAKEGKTYVVLGIGDNHLREQVADRCIAVGAEILTVVHPRATVSPSASLGAGTVVMAGAVINPEARVGRGVIVNTGAVLEHDVIVGDFAHIAPNAATGGAARLGAFSQLGLGAVVLQGIAIGCETIVGAGAVVTRDLPPGAVAFGVPARIHRYLDLPRRQQSKEISIESVR